MGGKVVNKKGTTTPTTNIGGNGGSKSKLKSKTANGKNAGKHKTPSTTTPKESESSTMSFSWILSCMLMGCLSLGMGILTPPTIHHLAAATSDTTESVGQLVVHVHTLVSRFLSQSQPQRGVISTTNPKVSCDTETLSNFLHVNAVPGMHVICVTKVEDSTKSSISLQLFKGAQLGVNTTVHLPSWSSSSSSSSSWKAIKQKLHDQLQLHTTDELHQPWAIFDTLGQKVITEVTPDLASPGKTTQLPIAQVFEQLGVVLLMEGGQWVWPGIHVGYKRHVDLYSIMPSSKPYQHETTTVVLETLSLTPLVLSVEGFLSTYECDYIQEKAKPKMRYSSVSFTDADQGKEASEFRTSQSTFLGARGDTTLQDINDRTASLVRIPTNHQEYTQVLRYGKTEHYVAHHDFFNPIFYKKDPDTLRMIQNGRRNRLATVFCYFSNVEKGGHTVFPRWNGAPSPTDFSDCTKGLKVKPQRGKVIIFYSQTPDGALDDLSLHGACPVEEGIKWAGNKWVWNEPIDFGE